ncbi:MAG: hypothetical protein KDN18_22965 [Verrucomicrobiae bacterium]|nr:hypothetical protein [Verrucomicrobiae bacterium]
MPTQAQNDRNLLAAARTGDVLIARVSLRDGANPNFVGSDHAALTYLKPTSPLQLAVEYARTEILEMLLAAGARVPEDARAQWHLSSAARHAGCPTLLLLLFRNGLRPTREDADWAEEHGHTAVKTYVLDQLGEYSITYDIDELLSLEVYKFYYKFAENVPGPYSPRDCMLFPEERVLRDVWEFECCTGSGFSTMLENQMFDVVERSYTAMQAIGESSALSATSELKSLFREHGIREKVDPHEEVYETLTDEIWEEIDGIDQKYFGGPNETDIWTNRTHLTLGMDYARQFIKILRKRKPKG